MSDGHPTPDRVREREFTASATAAMSHIITALNSHPDDPLRVVLFCDLAIDALNRAKDRA